LRQSHQLAEAIGWLEKLAEKAPDRARDAYVQIAEMELQRYADGRALAYAGKAAALAGDDPEALARIGEIEERAGRDEQAMATYRRALARGASGKAAAALHRLLVRRGSAHEAAEALRSFVRATTDEDARAELLLRVLDDEEYLGRLDEFERLLLGLDGHSTASKKVALALLQRLVPDLYAGVPTAPQTAALERAARWGVRPLLELVTEPDSEPDPAVIELLGMLGSRNATPVLLRLADGGGRAAIDKEHGPRMASSVGQVAAIIALGRLRDGRAVPTLAGLAMSPDAGVRAVALWALGRMKGPGVWEALDGAAADPRGDIAAVACLGLGRLHDVRAARTLVALATDLGRGGQVRQAAVLGLGLGELGDGGLLVPLLDVPHPGLARAAAAALGAVKDRRTLPGLWERVLFARGPGAKSALLALRAFAAPGGLGDEARVLRGARFDVEVLLEALSTSAAEPAGPELEALWIEHAGDLVLLLGRALEAGGEGRRRALEALDARDAGLGLGLLTATGPSPAAMATLQTIAERLRDRVAALLEDADPQVRRLAVRVASKLRDGRVSLSHVQALLAQPAPDGDTAALAARALLDGGRVAAGTLAEALRPFLADPSWERRLAAVRVMGLGGPAAGSQLARALRDPNPFVRAAAAEAVSTHRGSY
jgi:HEAT repeat protein